MNVPFIVWHPAAWLHGTFIPVVGGLVADGQGLVTLATHGVSGGVDLTMLSIAGGLAFVTILAAFVVWYARLKRVWLLLLPIPAFLLAAKSFQLSDRPLPGGRDRGGLCPRRLRGSAGAVREMEATPAVGRASGWRAADGSGCCVHLGLCGTSVELSVPRHVTVARRQGCRRNHHFRHNRSDSALTPHFMVNTGDNPHGFWLPSDDKSVIVSPRGSHYHHPPPAGADGCSPEGGAVARGGLHRRSHVVEYLVFGCLHGGGSHG